MGGFGSGSRNRYASKTDDFHSIDLATFKRAWFDYGRSGSIRWSRGDRETGSVGYRLHDQFMELDYVVTIQGERKPIKERFAFDFTEQHFGGLRRWLICPSCGRRVRVIYGGRYFRCRQCHGATYESQYEAIYLRGLNRTQRIRQKLGGEAGLMYPFPDKPAGMHWRTYRRLREKDFQAAIRMDRLLAGLL